MTWTPPSTKDRDPAFVKKVNELIPLATLDYQFWRWFDVIEIAFQGAREEQGRLKWGGKTKIVAEIEAKLAAVRLVQGLHGNERVEHGLWELETALNHELLSLAGPESNADVALQDAVDGLCALFATSSRKKVSDLKAGSKSYDEPNVLTRFVMDALAEFGEPLGKVASQKRIKDAIKQGDDLRDCSMGPTLSEKI